MKENLRSEAGVIYGLRCACHDDGYRYIGKTQVGIGARYSSHKHNATNELGPVYSLPVYRWMRKHGVSNIIPEVISRAETSTELDQLEIYLIQRFGTHVSTGGLNITLGGDGSRLLPRPIKPKKPDGRKGRKISPEGMKSIIASRVRGTNHPKAVLDSDTVKQAKAEIWDGASSQEVAERYGIKRSNMSSIVMEKSWKHIPWPSDRPRVVIDHQAIGRQRFLDSDRNVFKDPRTNPSSIKARMLN